MPPIAHHESRATTYMDKSIATKPERLQARSNVAQPGRAGSGDIYNSEHHRCYTFRPQTKVPTQTLKTRATTFPRSCSPSRSDRDGGIADFNSMQRRGMH